MNNSDIADLLKLYADLSELHGGNPFKIKSFASASFRIDKLPVKLEGKSVEELEKVEGVGKSLAKKIHEINETQSFEELDELLRDTPQGVLHMMRIKGIGPKKIAHIWHELGIESVGELLYACKENRLAQAKGFGLKTQQNVIQQIEFLFASADKFHYARVENYALHLLDELQKGFGRQASFCGAIRRRMEVLDCIEILAAIDNTPETLERIKTLSAIQEVQLLEKSISAKLQNYPLRIYFSTEENFATDLFLSTGSAEHIEQTHWNADNSGSSFRSEEDLYEAMGMQYIEPEMREGRGEVEKAKSRSLPRLIEYTDLRGPLHNHSIWSDGLNTVEEMARWCIGKGYEYLGMADHSKIAFYAKGMDEDKVFSQQKEIDELNRKLAPFRIFKGVECDILGDGSLDYSEEIWKSFDYIVASVHSNLKMTEEKAMTRLLKAIENPYTTILGHPTGRLLLMREGYPVDHKKMIDACAANGVAIEINANPYRLDLDWRWVDYALNKNVLLSINPDAHETEGFLDMYYGTLVARKGGLTKEMCLNAMNLQELSNYFDKKKA